MGEKEIVCDCCFKPPSSKRLFCGCCCIPLSCNPLLCVALCLLPQEEVVVLVTFVVIVRVLNPSGDGGDVELGARTSRTYLGVCV